MSDKTIELYPLPENWTWTKISELGKVVSGGTPSTRKPEYWGGDIAWITPADLSGYKDKFIERGAKSITQEGLENSSARLMPAGSIHFSSRAPIGYVVISKNSISTNQGFKSLVPAEGVFNEYIYYYLKSAKHLAEKFASGTTFKEISGKAFANLPVPLPPLNEQRRIVAKIEELFSELDAGVAALEQARAQLKRYRQALLKTAFEGRLTADWRQAHAGELEPAPALLARIRAEREARGRAQLAAWEKAVRAWEAAGKPGRKPKKPRKPKDLPPLTEDERAELPELPEGWAWVRVGEVFDVFVGSTPSRKRPEFWNGEINWVSSGEVAFSKISSTKEKISEQGLMNSSTTLHPVGTVMLGMIGEGKTRGQAAILKIKAAHNQNTAAIRVSEIGFVPEFLYYFLMLRYELTRSIGSGNNQKALNKTIVANMPYPLASIDEQREISAAIENAFIVLDHLDQTIEQALARAAALRQAILKRAFAGRLVAQAKAE